MRRHTIGIALATGLVVFACLAPTQVTVHVTTDVDCATVVANGTSIYAGDRTREPIATTRACDGSRLPHEVGTLVVVPSGANDERLSIEVVLGVRRPSEACADNGYVGCIVSRRRLRFVPSEPLELPIRMTLACLDVACNPNQTCFRGGCISAEVGEPRDGCLGPDCPSVSGASADATLVDAQTTSDATGPEGAVSDAGLDGAGDAIAPAPVAFEAPNGVLAAPFIPNVRARGLSIANGAIYWTDEATAPPGRSPLAAASPAPLAVPAGDYFGIAVNNSGQVIVAGVRAGAPGACAFIEPLDGGSTSLSCPAPGFGVADDGLRTFVTRPDLAQIDAFPRQGTTATVSSPKAYYGEAEFSLIHAATGAGIVAWEGQASATPYMVTPTPANGHGFALSPTHFFVTSATGNVWALSKSGGSEVLVLPAGTFAAAHDIAFDTGSGAIFVAARRADGSAAIWRLTGFEPLLP